MGYGINLLGRLLSILPIIILTSCASIPQDKLLHASSSLAISALLTAGMVAREDPPPVYIQAGLAIGTSLLVGTAKELSDDHFDWQDVEANFIGAITGWLVVEGTVWLYHKIKEDRVYYGTRKD